MTRILPLLVALLSSCLPAAAAEANPPSEAGADTTFESTIAPFFAKYCQDCHGEEKQKADRRFDTLAFPIWHVPPKKDLLFFLVGFICYFR